MGDPGNPKSTKIGSRNRRTTVELEKNMQQLKCQLYLVVIESYYDNKCLVKIAKNH